jgi:hypothetical protein
MTEKKKRKRVKPHVGQVVAIPLADGSFGLGHVAVFDISITIVLFARRARTPEALASEIERGLAEAPIAMMEVTSNELNDGEWPVIGDRPATYPPAMLDTKGKSFTSPMARTLLSAYHGLLAWDMMADPRYFEWRLLPGVKVPSSIRYKKDLEAAVKSETAKKADEITDGPAEIHVQIVYPGDDLPSIELLHRRQALEERLDASGAGEVTDAGAGEGVMDVFFATQDVKRALPVVKQAVADLGFEADALIEIDPLDEEDDDD